MAGAAAGKKVDMLIALGGLKKKPDAMTGAEPDADDEDAAPPMAEVKSTAAADVMAAFKNGDTTALEDALSRFVEACSSEGYEK